MVWLIARGLSNGKLDVQAPSQFERALDGVVQAQEDTRTGRQILDDLRSKLKSL